jgi:hypothetical protein
LAKFGTVEILARAALDARTLALMNLKSGESGRRIQFVTARRKLMSTCSIAG